MSGPLAAILTKLVGEMSASEFSEFIDDDTRARILRGVVENYYSATPAEVVFDTNRAWCARMPLLRQLFADLKVIACVRHMPWIIDSFERLHRRNALRSSGMFGYDANTTVYGRVESVSTGNGAVGYAFNALKEAYFGDVSPGQLMLLQYETLAAEPDRAMNAVYEFIGERGIRHDFHELRFDAVTFDEKMGLPGMHAVRPVVEAMNRDTVLPPDLFGRFENDSFWRQPQAARHGILIV